MKKFFMITGLMVMSLFFAGCISTTTPEVKATDPTNVAWQVAQMNEKSVLQSQPIPKVTNSVERANIIKRSQLFNAENKLSYIYLMSYGKIMANYTVKGKVSSLNSYLVPQQKLVKYNGDSCDWNYGSNGDCYTIDAPDIDGSYGTNPSGIFFFTTDGAYVEWSGDYMMSDQPMQLTDKPLLVKQK